MRPTQILRASVAAAKRPSLFTRQMQNLRKSPELIPLFSIVGFAVILGFGAWGHRLLHDPMVRLKRENVRGKQAAEKHH